MGMKFLKIAYDEYLNLDQITHIQDHKTYAIVFFGETGCTGRIISGDDYDLLMSLVSKHRVTDLGFEPR